MALKAASKKYQGVWINELKNGDISYYINYRDEDGKPTRVFVGKKTKLHDFTIKDAYQKLIEMKYKIQNHEEPVIKGGRTSKVKLNDLWEKYLIHAKNNKKSWRDDEIRYEKHIKPRFGNKAAKSLKPIDFETMKNELLSNGLSDSTVKHCLAIARQIFNYAIKNEFLNNAKNPIGNGRVQMPKVDNARLAFLTKAQAKELLRLLQVLDTTTYQVTAFLIFTGARFSEVASLKWQNINFKSKTIYFKSVKGGNSRYVAISAQLFDVIQKMKKGKDEENLFLRRNGTIFRCMPKYFDTAVNDVIVDNNTKETKYKITTHSLRHTHASWLAEAGLDILQIKEQLGHKSIEMTMRYAHLIPNQRYKTTQNLQI